MGRHITCACEAPDCRICSGRLRKQLWRARRARLVEELTLAEAAAQIGYSYRHALRLVHAGQLPATQRVPRGPWRIRQDAIAAFKEAADAR